MAKDHKIWIKLCKNILIYDTQSFTLHQIINMNYYQSGATTIQPFQNFMLTLTNGGGFDNHTLAMYELKQTDIKYAICCAVNLKETNTVIVENARKTN